MDGYTLDIPKHASTATRWDVALGQEEGSWEGEGEGVEKEEEKEEHGVQVLVWGQGQPQR